MSIDVEQRLRRAATVLDEHLTAHAISSDPMEVNVIIERSATPRSRRVLLAVSAFAVVAAVVVIVTIATGGDDDKVVTPVNVSTTTAPTTTTSVVPVSPDQKIADAILLPISEYSADWHVVDVVKITMDAEIASSVPACAPYVDVAFESPRRPAAVAYRWFKFGAKSTATAKEYVVVLADDAAAKAMFDAIQAPSFNDGCLKSYFSDPRYRDLLPDFPIRASDFTAPDLTLAGDQYTLRYFDDGATPAIGPDRYLAAIVRVGRTITVIETITQDDKGNQVMPLDHFQTIVANVVYRARSALN